VECKKGRLVFHFHFAQGNVAVGRGGMSCSVIYRICYTSRGSNSPSFANAWKALMDAMEVSRKATIGEE